MSKYTIEDATLTAVADKLREKTGQANGITPEEMPGTVEAVFEAGAKSEYDAFWDAFQQNGRRDYYNYGFSGIGWTKENFRPKYDMFPARSDCMFHSTSGLSGLDLPTHLLECGVILDTSNASAVAQMFTYCPIDRTGVINTTSAPSLSMIFYASKVRIIDRLVLKQDGSQELANAFYDTSNLESITIEGTIGRNGFDVSLSPLLTHDSLMSILNALQDKTGDTSGTVWTVTLGEANLGKLSEDEIAIAEEKGWVLA